MTLTVEERAKVLVEALPYIKRFHGQIVVISRCWCMEAARRSRR